MKEWAVKVLTYSQSSGILTGLKLAWQVVGYSGLGKGKNNPALQAVVGVGPIPRGLYRIGTQVNGSHLGPVALPLTPLFECERSGFFIHGDSTAHPGCASHGCIILSHAVRQEIVNEGYTNLEVTQ